ncbi:uncharacterized protein EDB91DRAFT_1350428 [Suillus paluster]|uniref:uncharacterized protein n=1 Tax=Suillus paluster TaxID=48578 RepID=UPI001B87D54A|nr:uncharacterized protein EDB91DRAFT_1350428 [Suillus paluster]KAG1726863.1 hypothetical protein EDB91DRAFT_1350428 [Suillus paluster]
MSQLIPNTTPLRRFKDHTSTIWAVAVSPDRRRMITSSWDKTLHLWDLNTGAVLKKMEHRNQVRGLAVSRDGQMIASGDLSGEVIVWHGETGEPLTQPIKAHSARVFGLDFSPDGAVLATGSPDKTMQLWSTKSWQTQGNPIKCSDQVKCIRYSPSGKHLAVATDSNIEIYNSARRERVASCEGHTKWNWSLAWTLDGTRLLSGGNDKDPTIREWDTSTWKQVGDPWTGHTQTILTIAIHPAGTHIASASDDTHVRLWRLSDRQTIAIFQHSSFTKCVTFSMDGKHILSGGGDNMISEWETPKGILSVNSTTRDACIAGDLSTAEELLTEEIDTNANNYTAYANRSFIMARKNDWGHALDDANKSIIIQPSLTGYISKGIALCGKGQVRDAKVAFDVAFMFTNENSNTVHFLLLAIALFAADEHEEAMLLLKELAAACPNNNALGRHVVEAYLCVQLGVNALNGARYDEAAEHFTAAVNCTTFPSTTAIDSIYKDLVMLFGWDLKSLWQDVHQKRCDALRQAGRHEEAVESYQHMMDTSDENTKANCLDWSNAFSQEYSAPHIVNGDAAFAASDYDKAIKSYSVAINLNSASDIIFANRSKSRSEKMLWEDALLDAQKVIELNPSSHVGYQVKHAALYGARRYDEAIIAFQMMLAKLDSAHDVKIRTLREQYLSPSEGEGVIRKVIDVQLNTAPLRLLNTATGLLCDREAQISAFKTSAEYNELLLSLTMKHPDIRMERITEVVATYFRCVMLSHRWEGTEPLLHDIKDKVVYEMTGAGSLVKLQSFCKIARKAEYHWAWVDSCCIDQHNNVEVQKSLNSMFGWYHDSALTAVYLSDVSPSSSSGALAKSAWNTRGWTVPEFLAPKVIRFYQQDWTPYLDDSSHNHKESIKIMHELQDATGIDARTLVAFQPGMRDAREKLQWVSMRITTVPEDIAYSLFGIFGVQLPILYGENKQNALGRLLQEIVARSGDITALNWVGQPSQFNSCLPASISSYAAPPRTLPSLSEDEIQTLVSSLRNTVAVEFTSKLYDQLDNMNAPRFAACRLHLPCIAFRVTEVIRNIGRAQETHFTYGVKADGLHDLLLTTKETLNQFTPARPPLQTFLLVYPWDRHLLELPDFAELPDSGDDTQSEDSNYLSPPESPLDESPGGSPVEQEMGVSDSHSRALRLIVRLGQPFSALMLARQRGGEYKRIVSDHDIVAQVKDVASTIHDMMDVRIVEIL